MTVVPLVVALLVTGIARTADSARGGRLAFRSVALFVLLLWTSTLIAAFLVPALLELWPMPPQAAAALNEALGQAHPTVAAAPGLADFLKTIVPSNPLAAAVDDAMLPLILFVMLFAIATTQIEAGSARPDHRPVRGDRGGDAGDRRLGAVDRPDRHLRARLRGRDQGRHRGDRRARPLYRHRLERRPRRLGARLSDGAVRRPGRA
jgi:hypothetical protein